MKIGRQIASLILSAFSGVCFVCGLFILSKEG
jgi:hypothetical protein